MTESSIKATDTSTTALAILCHYTDALLSVLDDEKLSSTIIPSPSNNHPKASDNQTANDRKANNQSHRVMWAFQDHKALVVAQTALKTESKNPATSKGNSVITSNATIKDAALFTLHELAIQPTPQRYQLACFWLPNLSSDMLQQYIPLLMRTRDLYAAHMIVALDNTLDLRAYGFTPLNLLDETLSLQKSSNSPTSLILWQFNLYDYKKRPNWLNADYWANPENWGKHRW